MEVTAPNGTIRVIIHLDLFVQLEVALVVGVQLCMVLENVIVTFLNTGIIQNARIEAQTLVLVQPIICARPILD
jgi:hypothetical protein